MSRLLMWQVTAGFRVTLRPPSFLQVNPNYVRRRSVGDIACDRNGQIILRENVVPG
jgi:hypothetical protein